GWIVVDHQSRNGTFVNGPRIADRSPVRIGDVIHFATRGYEVVPGAAGSGERMDPTVHTESISDVQGLVDLLHVIKDQRTFPHFQPVVDL
ncbi:MAG: FHA domain-containing protein, partial [Vicinamibacterales bacterium]|nr:FHA domain-containing protein [Vicinamibacterales bacterium]